MLVLLVVVVGVVMLVPVCVVELVVLVLVEVVVGAVEVVEVVVVVGLRELVVVVVGKKVVGNVRMLLEIDDVLKPGVEDDAAIVEYPNGGMRDRRSRSEHVDRALLT